MLVSDGNSSIVVIADEFFGVCLSSDLQWCCFMKGDVFEYSAIHHE